MQGGTLQAYGRQMKITEHEDDNAFMCAFWAGPGVLSVGALEKDNGNALISLHAPPAS